eukprot:363951-Chlamydomonas_euryale.AAC.7
MTAKFSPNRICDPHKLQECDPHKLQECITRCQCSSGAKRRQRSRPLFPQENIKAAVRITQHPRHEKILATHRRVLGLMCGPSRRARTHAQARVKCGDILMLGHDSCAASSPLRQQLQHVGDVAAGGQLLQRRRQLPVFLLQLTNGAAQFKDQLVGWVEQHDGR